MIAVDGSVEDEEMTTLNRIVKGDSNAYDQAFKIYKSKLDVAEYVQIISKTLDSKQRLATMAILLDIAMSDGMLAGAEKNLIQKYADGFKISDEFMKALAKVIALKNDFSVFK